MWALGDNALHLEAEKNQTLCACACTLSSKALGHHIFVSLSADHARSRVDANLENPLSRLQLQGACVLLQATSSF